MRDARVEVHEANEKNHANARSSLQQVVWNLLANAVRFTPRNGRVQVTLRRVNSHVDSVVSDTGEGIDPAVLPFIFEDFRQGPGHEHGGLGIGLALVRHLVELHGGEVKAASDGLNPGATFTSKSRQSHVEHDHTRGVRVSRNASRPVAKRTGLFDARASSEGGIVTWPAPDSRSSANYVF